MNRRLANAALTLILAAGAGIGGVWAGSQMFGTKTAPSLHDVVHRDLNLTQAQEAEIDAMEAAFSERRRVLESEMRAANAELAAAIKASDTPGPEVSAAVVHFHDAMGTLQTETIAHVFDMRSVLTPEQRTRFDETVVLALTPQTQ